MDFLIIENFVSDLVSKLDQTKFHSVWICCLRNLERNENCWFSIYPNSRFV